MSGSHFYLTLPSNASLDVFPDNKTTGYRVQLPQIVNLEGDRDVGNLIPEGNLNDIQVCSKHSVLQSLN